MAAAAAFGANAVADAALPVPRTAKARGIGPGRHVSAPRYIFGEEWARKQSSGRTVRVYGTVQRALGKHHWEVAWCDGTTTEAVSRQLRQEQGLPDGIPPETHPGVSRVVLQATASCGPSMSLLPPSARTAPR